MTFTDAAVRDALRKPFDKGQVGKLPKPTKKENAKGKCKDCGGWHGLPAVHLDFVGHAAVTDRLNKVAPGWTYTVDELFNVNSVCWVRGTMTVGDVSRPEFGDGRDPKEAIGNFIRRAAMRFGVAIDLWSKEELTTSDVGSGSLEGSSPASGSTPDVSGEPSLPTSGTSNGMVSGESPDRPSPGHETPLDASSTASPDEGLEAAVDRVAAGEGRADGEAVSPSSAVPSELSERDAYWMNLVQLYGSETKARNAVNRTTKGTFTAATISSATAEQLAATIEAAA